MKRLLILFSFLLLSSCEDGSAYLATVKVNHIDKSTDTVTVQYNQKLYLFNHDLYDGQGNVFSYNVNSYSIIDSVKTIK